MSRNIEIEFKNIVSQADFLRIKEFFISKNPISLHKRIIISIQLTFQLDKMVPHYALDSFQTNLS